MESNIDQDRSYSRLFRSSDLWVMGPCEDDKEHNGSARGVSEESSCRTLRYEHRASSAPRRLGQSLLTADPDVSGERYIYFYFLWPSRRRSWAGLAADVGGVPVVANAVKRPFASSTASRRDAKRGAERGAERGTERGSRAVGASATVARIA